MMSLLWLLGALALLPVLFDGGDKDTDQDDTDGGTEGSGGDSDAENPDDEDDTSDTQGTVGGDLLTGTEDDNTLSGWPDEFSFEDSFGDDTLYGGGGDDSLSAPYGDDLLYGGQGNDTLGGFDGDDTLYGGAGDDHVDGSFGQDLLFGYTGNDVLAARDGGDTLLGGRGDDTLNASGAQTELFGGAGNDYLVFAGQTIASGGQGADQFYYLEGTIVEPLDSLTAEITDFDPNEDHLTIEFDALVSGNADIQLQLVDWADGTGADLMFEDQVLIRIAGAQDMDPSEIQSFITIAPALGGENYLDGPASSVIIGGDSADRIFGGGGNDRINVAFADGKAGQDLIGDLADGGDGNDTLIGRGGDTYFDSYDDDDTQGERVVLVHEDTLIGGAGDDVLRAENGSMMTGGTGADLFEVFLADADLPDGETFPPARITDFDPTTDSLMVEAAYVQDPGPISIVAWADGLGADVLVGQTVVARVTGGQDLTVDDLVQPQAA